MDELERFAREPAGAEQEERTQAQDATPSASRVVRASSCA